jgi:hypothetical protein
MTDDFEMVIRARMKSHAAELDRSLPPAPPMRALLGSPAKTTRRFGSASLRFGLGMVAAIALVVAVICGDLLFQALPQVQPLATIGPSVVPSLASPSPSLASPPPSRASPTPSPAAPSASLALAFELPPAS